ncbi:MAG: YceI family protein [Streptosporangiaceae bacterium]
MALYPGRHRFGNDQRGRLLLTTSRDGLAAQAGHDLTIEVNDWSAELTVSEDLRPIALVVRVDLNSLSVLDGTGGVKPLTDRDRREIAANARKSLKTNQFPAATFTAAGFESAGGGGVVPGTLALAGAERQLRLDVASTGPDRYLVTGSVRQTDFGIKPYSAFLGALRVSDIVGVRAEIDLSGLRADAAEADGGAGGTGDGAGGTGDGAGGGGDRTGG